jgi:hypothetical protein
MAVVVVPAHADHADPRVHRRQEIGIGVCRTVVRNLEHVRGDVHAVGQHGLLRLDLDVARQQDANATDRGTKYQGGIVRVGSRVVERRRGGKDLQLHLADVERRADRRCGDGEAVRAELVVHEFDAGGRLGQRTGDHLLHRSTVQHAGDSADVVQVVVREHQ